MRDKAAIPSGQYIELDLNLNFSPGGIKTATPSGPYIE